ncbi:MAG: hypothetical protein IPO40_24700 [Fibrobacteres bacterium]|nr:hypothetical protein [Fibrobacterota bacterium]
MTMTFDGLKSVLCVLLLICIEQDHDTSRRGDDEHSLPVKTVLHLHGFRSFLELVPLVFLEPLTARFDAVTG